MHNSNSSISPSHFSIILLLASCFSNRLHTHTYTQLYTAGCAQQMEDVHSKGIGNAGPPCMLTCARDLLSDSAPGKQKYTYIIRDSLTFNFVTLLAFKQICLKHIFTSFIIFPNAGKRESIALVCSRLPRPGCRDRLADLPDAEEPRAACAPLPDWNVAAALAALLQSHVIDHSSHRCWRVC